MDLVTRGSCGKRFPVEGLTTDQCRALEDQHYHNEFVEELRMLEKAQGSSEELVQRHDDVAGRPLDAI
jgi:hypothetical protein